MDYFTYSNWSQCGFRTPQDLFTPPTELLERYAVADELMPAVQTFFNEDRAEEIQRAVLGSEQDSQKFWKATAEEEGKPVIKTRAARAILEDVVGLIRVTGDSVVRVNIEPDLPKEVFKGKVNGHIGAAEAAQAMPLP